MMTPQEALARAIDVAGGQVALSRRIGARQNTIHYWLHKTRFGVAAEFVLAIESATGVPRHALRPDLYPLPEQGEVA